MSKERESIEEDVKKVLEEAHMLESYLRRVLSLQLYAARSRGAKYDGAKYGGFLKPCRSTE